MKEDQDEAFVYEPSEVDGIAAVRRRKVKSGSKTRRHYFYAPMDCMVLLANADLPPSGWKLAIWVLWHHRVSSGGAATISATFAKRAGLNTRAARRYAVAALEATGLFDVIRKGKAAAKVTPGSQLKTMLKKND
jgi:hypothetical protein